MSSSTPSLSVLIATHNGATTLPRVLNALAHQVSVPGGWQLVVADNASTDSTAQVLASYAERLPLTVVAVPRQGKNIALNAALPQIRGALVLLTDDDIVASPEWLAHFRQAAERLPRVDLFGGPIEALWPEGRCPDWIVRLVNIGATFGVTPAHLQDGPVAATQVWGGNMAVRKSVFDAGFRFNESVGPAAGQYAMGSEVEFSSRLAREGRLAWFVNQARVGHIIRASQLKPEWIVGRAYRLGRHMFHQEHNLIGVEVPRFRGAPRWRWRQYWEQRVLASWARFRRDNDGRFLAEWESSFLRGYLDEAERGTAGVRS